MRIGEVYIYSESILANRADLRGYEFHVTQIRKSYFTMDVYSSTMKIAESYFYVNNRIEDFQLKMSVRRGHQLTNVFK